MPLRPLTGSNLAIAPAATRPVDAVAERRMRHAHVEHSTRARVPRERDWSAAHDLDSPERATAPRENEFAHGAGRKGRPHFTRLHASIAERPLDWAWQHRPETGAAGKSERGEGGPAAAGFSTRALWVGGIAFALLASGIISAVATVQSSRPLPFEAWARLDLLHYADAALSALSPATEVSQQAVAREGALSATARPVAAGHDLVALAGERAPGEADAALIKEGVAPSPVIEIAGLGPVLAGSAAGEQVAANLALLSLTRAGAGPGTPSTEPPRPVFKPALLSSLQPNGAAHPSLRR